jgi:hypothetical protein
MRAGIAKAWKILLLCALTGILIGCELCERDFSLSQEIMPAEGKGALILELDEGPFSGKTLTPSISMEIGSFDIYGEGPDPSVDLFEDLGNTTGSLSRADLTPGEWIIRVDARNPNVEGDPDRNGTIIGHGEAIVQINAGAVTTAQIEVEPFAGPDHTGELYLAIQWQRGTIPNPSIEYSFTRAGSSTQVPLTFSKHPPGNPDRFVCEDAVLEAGYYFLTLQLLSGNELYRGIAEAVRIVAGETTSKTYQLN